MNYHEYAFTKRQPRRRRKFLIIPLLFVLFYVAALLFWPLGSISAQITEPPTLATKPMNLAWPTYGQSAVGASVDDTVLASSATEQSVPIASITKTITVLVVLERKPLSAGQSGPIITFTADDAARYNHYLAQNGSVARSDSGLQLTEYQVLQGIFLASANNYADALAIWAYGSMDNYLAAAQKYLAAHSLKHTTVVDASGFDPGSQSTAKDLVHIGRLALSQSAIKDIVSQKSATIPGIGTLYNTNRLLDEPDVIGIKTGNTDQAGTCLLFAAAPKINGKTVEIVGAVLGAPDHPTLFRDSQTLLASAKSNIIQHTYAHAATPYVAYKTPWGSLAKSAPVANDSTLGWSARPPKITVSGNKVHVGAKSGTDTGAISVNTNLDASTKLVLQNDLKPPSWTWRLTHPLQTIWK